MAMKPVNEPVFTILYPKKLKFLFLTNDQEKDLKMKPCPHAKDLKRWTDEVERLYDIYDKGELPWCPFTDHPVVPEGSCLTWETCRKCSFFHDWSHAQQVKINAQSGGGTLPVESDCSALPKLNIRCECSDGIVQGSTYLNVVKVEQEDDGSFTAVTDYWPNVKPGGVRGMSAKLTGLRFRVEARSGIVAVYDTAHPDYHDTPGCHADYPWTVCSWGGSYDQKTGHWNVDQRWLDKAHATCDLLNELSENVKDEVPE